MILEEEIQKEVVRLLNRWAEGYETELLEMFAKWTNYNLISDYEIIEVPDNYAKSDIWILRKRK